MQLFSNRLFSAGILITIVTALTALTGASSEFAGFPFSVVEVLLQLNLCSGIVFLVFGVLHEVETPVPDVRSALHLLASASAFYALACTIYAALPGSPGWIQLFLFALSLSCVVAGWASFGLSLLRQLDAQE